MPRFCTPSPMNKTLPSHSPRPYQAPNQAAFSQESTARLTVYFPVFWIMSSRFFISSIKIYPVPASSRQTPYLVYITTQFSITLRPNQCARCLLAALACTPEDWSVLHTIVEDRNTSTCTASWRTIRGVEGPRCLIYPTTL